MKRNDTMTHFEVMTGGFLGILSGVMAIITIGYYMPTWQYDYYYGCLKTHALRRSEDEYRRARDSSKYI